MKHTGTGKGPLAAVLQEEQAQTEAHLAELDESREPLSSRLVDQRRELRSKRDVLADGIGALNRASPRE